MNIIPFQDNLETIMRANADAELLDLQSQVTPAGMSLEKLLAAGRASDEADRRFDEWKTDLEISAGRAGQPVERLRSEHPEPELSEAETPWVPGMDPDWGLGKSDGGVPAIRERGLPGTARKLKNGTVLVFGADGAVSACYSDGSAPAEVLEMIEQ